MSHKTNGMVAITLFLMVVIVWIPNQFQTSAIQEEWRIRAMFDGNITTYGDSGNDTADEIFYTRPVIGALNRIAYILTPDSFLSHHIILMLLLTAKGFVLFLIFCQLLPQHRLLAYFCAILFLFYPSDTAIVSLRVIHTHLAVLLILLSIDFFLRYFQQSRRRYLIAMGLCQFIAGFTIEIGYPIFFFTPLLTLILEKKVSRKWIMTTIQFYVVPAITFLYSIVLILVVEVSWQRTAIESYTPGEYFWNIVDLYRHNFVTAWESVLDTIINNGTPVDSGVLGATVIVVFVGGILIARGQQQITSFRDQIPRLGLSILVGGIVVLLGYAMFLSSRTHVLTDFRVYLLSSIGAATVIGTLVYAIYLAASRYVVFRYAVILGFSVLVGLSSAYANRIHREFLAISKQQEQVARELTQAVPALSDDAYILIKIRSNGVYRRFKLGEIQKPILFTPMMQYIYNDYEKLQAAVICFTDYLTCNFNPDGVDIAASNFLNFETPIPYEQLILFDIDSERRLTLIEPDASRPGYDPSQLIDSEASPPRRIETIYGAP